MNDIERQQSLIIDCARNECERRILMHSKEGWRELNEKFLEGIKKKILGLRVEELKNYDPRLEEGWPNVSSFFSVEAASENETDITEIAVKVGERNLTLTEKDITKISLSLGIFLIDSEPIEIQFENEENPIVLRKMDCLIIAKQVMKWI